MNATKYILNNDAPDNQVALLTSQGDHTYADLKRGVSRVANYLVRRGARKGDRVALIAEASYFWVVTYLGTIRAGCVAVPLPVNIDVEECAYILETTECTWGFVQGKYARDYLSLFNKNVTLVVNEPERIPTDLVRNTIQFANILAQTDMDFDADLVEVDERKDLAALMFTSGSTGKPRGVMVSHRNIIANTNSIVEYLELTADDRIMAVLPLYYCFGTSLLHTHLRVGGSVVISTHFVFPNKVLKRMQETHCTGFAGVPSTYQILLRRSSLKKMEFPNLRYVQQAGGKLPDIFIAELRQALPTTRVFVMYGQTEATARLSYLPHEMLDTKSGSIGKGIPGVKLQVLDESNQPVPPGEIGEIVAEGDNITLGYWKAPKETNQSFRNGRLYTGDLATVDEDGYIFVVDRAKDFLKCGGQRVSCKEIEGKVLRFEGLVEAAVISQPDDTLGEAVRLYVVHPAGEAKRVELEQFCMETLPRNLVPRMIIFRDALPKNTSGKLNKVVLKEEYRKQVESRGY